MNYLYYVEVNLICVIFLAFISRKITHRVNVSFADKIFNTSIICSALICIADAVSGSFDGKSGTCTYYILQISNIIYFLFGTISAFCWLYYVCLKFNIVLSKLKLILILMPCIISGIISLTNPLTNLFYSITVENHYCRGSIIYVYWLVVFFYLSLATGISIIKTRQVQNKILRDVYISFCLFGVFPTIGFILQVFLFGSTTISVGVALGFLFYYIRSLESQISEDVLTGLYNRKQLEIFTNDLIHNNSGNPIFTIMMDINDFKQINDKYGHASGDKALMDFALALKLISQKWVGNYILCRYGGDEFSIVGELLPGESPDDLIKIIQHNIAEISKKNKRTFNLEASYGYAYSICKTSEDFIKLHNLADEKMYAEKRLKKAGR